jgi:hypothetical protein
VIKYVAREALRAEKFIDTLVLIPILNNLFCEFMKGQSAQTIKRGKCA